MVNVCIYYVNRKLAGLSVLDIVLALQLRSWVFPWTVCCCVAWVTPRFAAWPLKRGFSCVMWGPDVWHLGFGTLEVFALFLAFLHLLVLVRNCFWIRRKYVASSFARHWAAPLPGASMCRSWASRRSSDMFFHASLFGEDSSETWVFVTFLNHLTVYWSCIHPHSFEELHRNSTRIRAYHETGLGCHYRRAHAGGSDYHSAGASSEIC